MPDRDESGNRGAPLMPDAQEPAVITTARQLDELVEHLRQAGRFAFDTEFVSEDTYEPVLCLVQVATTERLAAVDTVALRDVGPLWELVNDPSVEVVMHAAGEDLRICRFQTGRVPQRVYDVQIAAGLAGFAYPLSLGNLVSQLLQTSVFGGETRTDWRKRPLTPAQIRYALDDVRHLLRVADRLEARLVQLGRRSWADDEFRDFLAEVVSRGDEERWRRLPGLNQLGRRGLEAARRLYEWRQSEARRLNRPVRQVLRDDLLVGIAKRQPKTKAELEALRDFNRPHLLSKSGDILAEIRASLEVPTEQLPEPSERHDEGPGLAMIVSLLAAAMAKACAEAKVATALFGSNGDLKDLIRWHNQGQPEDLRPALASGWRREICGDLLLDVLSGRRALRVVDASAEHPVAVEPRESPGDDLGRARPNDLPTGNSPS